MSTPDDHVSEHYTSLDLEQCIWSALAAQGKDVSALTIDDLAAVDGFHIRGRQATAELAQWVQIRSTDRVLDVGCGLGGTARYLASLNNCRVTGIDLTADYCRVAALLSERVGLGERTEFKQASALALPFGDATFDVLWTEHAQMNVADKTGFYAEIRRVLKPGGFFAFHDIFAGNGEAVKFPVPWAEDDSISHLITVNELMPLLNGLGFETVRCEDKTAVSTEFFEAVNRRFETQGRPAMGIHLLMGENAAIKFQNIYTNLRNQRLSVIKALMR